MLELRDSRFGSPHPLDQRKHHVGRACSDEGGVRLVWEVLVHPQKDTAELRRAAVVVLNEDVVLLRGTLAAPSRRCRPRLRFQVVEVEVRHRTRPPRVVLTYHTTPPQVPARVRGSSKSNRPRI